MRAPALMLLVISLTACISPKPKQTEVVERAPADWTHELLLEAQRSGYKLVTRSGEQVLCRQDALTGSRVNRRTLCMTLREWQRTRITSRETLDDLTRGQKPSCAIEKNC